MHKPIDDKQVQLVEIVKKMLFICSILMNPTRKNVPFVTEAAVDNFT